MPLDTYANLQASILSWLARPDDPLVSPSIPDIIQLFESEANRRLKVGGAEKRVSLTALSAAVALPADFGELRLATSGGVILTYVTPMQLPDGGGPPAHYTIVGNEMRLGPSPSASCTIEIVYQSGVPPLSDTNISNWLLAAHPDCYLFGSLVEAESFIGSDDRIPLWAQRREAAFASIETADRKARWGGAPLSIRAEGVQGGNGTAAGDWTTGVPSTGPGYAPLASPVFTGNPQAPTPPPGDNDTSIATTAFVAARVLKAGDTMTGTLNIQLPATGAGLQVGATTGDVSVNIGQGIGAADAYLQISNGRTANGSSVIDLVGDTTYPDYGLRVSRGGGANGNSSVFHRGTGALLINATEAGTLDFATTNTLRGRIAANGAFGWGSGATNSWGFNVINAAGTSFLAVFQNSSAGASNAGLVVAAGLSGSDVGSSLVTFYNGTLGAVQGAINRNGAAAVAYATSSDERLKQDIEPTTVGLAALLGVQVRDFAFIAEPDVRHQGLVAQELFEVYPEAVVAGNEAGDGISETTPWMIDYGRLTPLLIRAVQELAARVAALEAGK